jgi:nicotinate-nucleotide pyrophosphorylase (carboxylating)
MQKPEERALAVLPPALQEQQVIRMIEFALSEDLAPDARLPGDPAGADATSAATLDPDGRLQGRIFAKADGIAAGLPVAAAVFRYMDAGLEVERAVSDGSRVQSGDLLMRVWGPGRTMLAAERTALNFLGRMSGVATLTSRFVDAVSGTRAVILDTRKTAPGHRLLDKYSVRMGGGRNHRMGLYDMALIKDNHIDGAGGIQAAVAGVRTRFGAGLPIEVEVKDLTELETALELDVDRILLDNMSLAMMRSAVELVGGRIPLEASGNVSLQTVRAIAETGVDFISSGALTHSVSVFDISMRLEK